MILIRNWKRPYERRPLPVLRLYAVIRLVGGKHRKKSTRYAVPEAGSSWETGERSVKIEDCGMKS